MQLTYILCLLIASASGSPVQNCSAPVDHVALVQRQASVKTSGAHYYVCVGTADKWGAGTDQNCYVTTFHL